MRLRVCSNSVIRNFFGELKRWYFLFKLGKRDGESRADEGIASIFKRTRE